MNQKVLEKSFLCQSFWGQFGEQVWLFKYPLKIFSKDGVY